MHAFSDDGGVYASFDFLKYPWFIGARNLLLRRCYAEGNPSTLYIKDVEYFYTLDRHEEGLALLKTAADGGYDRVRNPLFLENKVPVTLDMCVFWNYDEPKLLDMIVFWN